MTGNVKLMTSAGGGVVLDTATTTATDVTVKVPVTGVNNGTLVCSDSSGNVGIGTTTPLLTATNRGNVTVNGASDSILTLGVGGTATGYFYADASNVQVTARTNIPLVFNTNNTERMRIDSSGNLLVGTTTNLYARAGFANAGNCITTWNSGGTSGYFDQILFFNNQGTTSVGSIQRVNNSTVQYNTSSDYRLKENIQPMTGALEKVAQLNPVTYTWKADGSDGQGFIAHELQAVVPDCVSGEKDAVDAEGNPVYQGIDTSFLVATLTKAIQEQQAQIETLTAKVAALEAK